MKLVKHAIFLSFAIVVLLTVAYITRHALLLIYVSGIFAVVLSPAVDWICKLKIGRWHPSRGLAIVFIVVAAAAVISVISFFAFPAVVEQVREFTAQLPDLLSRLKRRFGERGILAQLDVRSFSNYLTAHMAALTSVFGTIAGALTSTATVFLLTA
jgi:predicted PurR-regulated permease PerM